MGNEVKNFGEYYSKARTMNPNKDFLLKLTNLIGKGNANLSEIKSLKESYDNVRMNEKNKILTISKEELYSLGNLLGLKEDKDKKSMRTVLNTLIRKSKVSQPEVSQPEVSQPEVSQPEVSQPEVSQPEVSQPEVSQPEVSQPEVSQPEVSQPEVSQPEVSQPEVSQIDYSESDFGYKEPLRDLEGLLLARTDLLSSDKVESGYNSIGDLFTKLNSINETQVEPLFKPYYYGENNIENGEKVPTFIIVGDMHADEYNLGSEDDSILISNIMRKSAGNFILLEEDESSNAEISSMSILVNSFGLGKNIGLENVVYGHNGEGYGIADGLKKNDIPFIGLEYIKEYSDTDGIFIESLKNGLKSFQSLGIDLLKINPINKNEFIRIGEKHLDTLIEKINISEPFSEEKVLKEFNYEKLEKLNKDERLELAQFTIYLYEKMFGKDMLSFLLLNLGRKVGKKELLESVLLNGKKNYQSIIEKRNMRGIEYMNRNMQKDKVAVMVYGKAHIADLIKQLKEKYNGKVNIYVVK